MLCLEEIAIHNPLNHVRESACRLIAAIINKLPEGTDLYKKGFRNYIIFQEIPFCYYGDITELITGSDFDAMVESLCQKKNDPSIDRQNAIRLFIWITKALVMRAYSKIEQYIQEVQYN